MPGMDDENTSGMIALIPRADDAAALVVPGGEPVEEMHLTLTYLGNDVTTWSAAEQTQALNAAGAAASQLAAVQARIMAHALFNPDAHEGRSPCAVYLVSDSAVLAPLRNVLAQFAAAEQHEPFIPHVTAGYGVPIGKLSFVGPIVFDRLRVALGGQVMDYPLGDPEEIKRLMTYVESKGKMPSGLAEKFKKKGPGKASDDKGATADAGINNIGDLAKAVKTYKAAKADQQATMWPKIQAAAKKLNAAKMVAGLTKPKADNASEKKMFEAVALEYKVTSPDPRAAKLRQWWARDPKAVAMWKPGVPGDFKRLVRALRKHTPIKDARIIKGLAANIHHLALGEWPGREGRKEAFDWLDTDVLESKALGAEMDTSGADLFAQYKAVRAELSSALGEDDDEPDTAEEASQDPGDDGVSPEEAYAEGLADDIDWTIEGDGTLEDPEADDLDSPSELGETSEDEDDEDADDLSEVDDIFNLVTSAPPK